MRQTQSGFTLVETIVALVLLELGMLALAATAGVAARDLSDTLLRRRAFSIAESHTEWLRASACSATGTGVRVPGAGMVEYWFVTAASRTRSITDSVSISLTRGFRGAAVVKASVLCGG